MSKIKYTKEQQKVIYSRNRNLLVSAAAGSGKTAVLVERIIQMILDKHNPLDIDKLLVVTFTNAAASEMRERIGLALEKKLEEETNNKFIHKQLILLSNANIMTIHAFCLKIIKNYYHKINLDPSFRIGDENELALLKKDLIKEILEKYFKNPTKEFIKFVESFSSGKTDDNIEEILLNIDQFSISNPWPEKWLNEMVENVRFEDLDKFQQSIYYKILMKETKKRLSFVETYLEQSKNICELENGPAHYLPAVDEYISQIDNIKDKLNQDYDSIKKALDEFSTVKLSAKRKGFDKKLRDKAKKLIDIAKEEITKLRETYYYNTSKEILKDCESSYEIIKVAVEIVKDFRKEYQIRKENKNIIDFNDIEHLALKILIDEEGKPTEVANELRESFEEILIDEYQDSNMVQETILRSISKESLGKPNMFMVGDVKQSIYKFRLAKPEIFMEKYETYTVEDSDYQLINLHKNFRSRKEVLDSINYIFTQIMSKELGNVIYNDEVALNLGANYVESEGVNYSSEVLLIDSNNLNNDSINEKQLEARVIGNQIQELIQNKFPVLDKEQGIYRPIKYKDIVILLRTSVGWSNEFLEELTKMGIPMYSNSGTGYFDTMEISTIVNLLKVIDNPRQDLPLVAILRSPIVGLTGSDLVKIRKWRENVEFYDALISYYNGTTIKDELYEKVDLFLRNLKEWRKKSTYLSIDELIHLLYEETNYYNYVTLLPRGKQRKANLDIFVDRAISFEKTSYRGLFNFIRYIENMKKYEIELGEASIFSENDDLVKIMSIHKSKGLEFPVVFVAGLGKQFNMMDLKQEFVCHQDLGFGVDYVDIENRFSIPTITKNIIKLKIKEELFSEELRILYVALTRAKEKLYMVGTIKDIKKKSEDWCEVLNEEEETISSYILQKQNKYIDWIMLALAKHPCGDVIRKLVGENLKYDLNNEHSKFNIQIINYEDVLDSIVSQQNSNKEVISLLNKWKDQKVKSDFSKTLEWKYPLEPLTKANVSLSVSEIKRKKIQLDELSSEVIETINTKDIIPGFMVENRKLTSAEKGIAMHKVMYHLNYEMQPNKQFVEEYLDKLEKKKIISKKERESINIYSIIKFLNSSVVKRMIKSSYLKRETPFVIGIPVSEIINDLDINIEEHVMIQGVIDVFFEEDNGLVLLDFKTDYLKKGQEELLIKRYKEQMSYYKRALEQMLNKRVKEIILYSTSLSKEINVKI